jgi:hypothetical protein
MRRVSWAMAGGEVQNEREREGETKWTDVRRSSSSTRRCGSVRERSSCSRGERCPGGVLSKSKSQPCNWDTLAGEESQDGGGTKASTFWDGFPRSEWFTKWRSTVSDCCCGEPADTVGREIFQRVPGRVSSNCILRDWGL